MLNCLVLTITVVPRQAAPRAPPAAARGGRRRAGRTSVSADRGSAYLPLELVGDQVDRGVHVGRALPGPQDQPLRPDRHLCHLTLHDRRVVLDGELELAPALVRQSLRQLAQLPLGIGEQRVGHVLVSALHLKLIGDPPGGGVLRNHHRSPADHAGQLKPSTDLEPPLAQRPGAGVEHRTRSCTRRRPAPRPSDTVDRPTRTRSAPRRVCSSRPARSRPPLQPPSRASSPPSTAESRKSKAPSRPTSSSQVAPAPRTVRHRSPGARPDTASQPVST